MADTLINRLRGQYEIGPNAEFGVRDMSEYMPPICKEAADRIEELERAIDLIESADESISENPIGLIHNICREVGGS